MELQFFILEEESNKKGVKEWERKREREKEKERKLGRIRESSKGERRIDLVPCFSPRAFPRVSLVTSTNFNPGHTRDLSFRKEIQDSRGRKRTKRKSDTFVTPSIDIRSRIT